MKKQKQYYVVGKVINVELNQWEFVGVFDTKEKAVSACLYDNYFIGPVELNNTAPYESVAWDGAFYPKLQ